jgi:hypothetical protein
MAGSLVVDGIPISDQTDFESLVRETLEGRAVLPVLPDDMSPLQPLERFLDKLQGTPFADRLTRAIARWITADDRGVRGQAMAFFESHPMVAGAERVYDLVEGDRSLFQSGDPVYGEEFYLLRILGARLRPGDRRGIDLARAEALKPDKAMGALAGLIDVDAAWVIDHAEQIVHNTADAYGPILLNLCNGDPQASAQLGRRLARIPEIDGQDFRQKVEQYVSNPLVRARILSALPS